MDLSGTVDSFSSTYTVTRTVRGTFDNHGDPVAGSTSTVSISAVVEPARGRDLLRVPEGLRTEEGLVVYTTAQLLTANTSNEPDTLSYAGETYQVALVERWDVLANYWRATLVKVGAL